METSSQQNKYSALKGDELILKYKVRQPLVDTAHPGLLILLHGVGGNEENLFGIAGSLPKDMVIVAARGPYTLDAGRYAWYQVDFSSGKPVIDAEQAEKSLLVLKLFINQLVELYHIDHSRVYMGGFSQGAIMSYSAGLTYPEKLKGIAALSGRILEEIRPLIKPSPALDRLKVFIAHGTEDQMLPVFYAREAKAFIDTYKLAVTYHEYQMGHAVDEQVLSDLNKWLEL